MWIVLPPSPSQLIYLGSCQPRRKGPPDISTAMLPIPCISTCLMHFIAPWHVYKRGESLLLLSELALKGLTLVTLVSSGMNPQFGIPSMAPEQRWAALQGGAQARGRRARPQPPRATAALWTRPAPALGGCLPPPPPPQAGAPCTTRAHCTSPSTPKSCNLKRLVPSPSVPLLRLDESRTLLGAQKDVNRVLDAEVKQLMLQLEDLNRRYATQSRRSAELAEQLESVNSADFQALRHQLQRAKQDHADLEKVRPGVEGRSEALFGVVPLEQVHMGF